MFEKNALKEGKFLGQNAAVFLNESVRSRNGHLIYYWLTLIEVCFIQVFRLVLTKLSYFQKVQHLFWMRLISQLIMVLLAVYLLRADLIRDFQTFRHSIGKTLIFVLIGYVVLILWVAFFTFVIFSGGDTTADQIGRVFQFNPYLTLLYNTVGANH